jgi:hypothetical protein
MVNGNGLIGQTPQNGTAIWVSEPNGRGTYSILSTCVITLGLCVWSALHLNIPAAGQEHKQKWRKLLWLFVGIFAPEIVAWTAFEQYKQARHIQKFMNKQLDQKEPSLWEKCSQCFR